MGDLVARQPCALALAMLLAGCGSLPADIPQFGPDTYAPMRSATQAAARDCGGPFVSWSRVTSTSLFPYRIETSEWMRCLKDGRIVGPYTYSVDPL